MGSNAPLEFFSHMHKMKIDVNWNAKDDGFFYCSFFVAAFTMANVYGVEKPKISRQCLRIEAGKIMPQKMKRKI